MPTNPTTSTTTSKKLDLFEINKDIVMLYKKYFVYLLYFGIIAASISFFAPESDKTTTNYFVKLLIFSPVSGIVNTAATVVLLWFINKNEQKDPLSLRAAMGNALPYTLMYYLTWVYVLFISLLAAILFIIPGVILGIMYSQATLFVLFKNKKLLEALSSSNQLTKGYRMLIFRIYAQLGILGLLQLGILTLISSLSPQIGQSNSLILKDLFSTIVNIFLIYPIGPIITYAIWRALTGIQPFENPQPASAT